MPVSDGRPLLEVTGLGKRFGGFVALDEHRPRRSPPASGSA